VLGVGPRLQEGAREARLALARVRVGVHRLGQPADGAAPEREVPRVREQPPREVRLPAAITRCMAMPLSHGHTVPLW
jgi:hypothetical protein